MTSARRHDGCGGRETLGTTFLAYWRNPRGPPQATSAAGSAALAVEMISAVFSWTSTRDIVAHLGRLVVGGSSIVTAESEADRWTDRRRRQSPPSSAEFGAVLYALYGTVRTGAAALIWRVGQRRGTVEPLLQSLQRQHKPWQVATAVHLLVLSTVTIVLVGM